MPFFAHDLHQNDKILMLLILTFEDKRSYEIVKYLPKDKESLFKKEIDNLLNNIPQSSERYSFLLKEIKSFHFETQSSKMEDIHFSWLSDALQQEQPQVIAVILNFLPKDKTTQILSTFDVSLREEISCPLQILPVIREVIKKRFEDKFLPMRALKDTTYYKVLISLKEEDFFKLIRKMGLQELAIALRGIDISNLSKVIKSISQSDEEQLLQKMRELEEVDYEKIKVSQKNIRTYMHIFNNVKDIFWEIGLLKLAQLLKGEDNRIIHQIYQKLPKLEVNKLDQYLNKIDSTLTVEEKDKIVVNI